MNFKAKPNYIYSIIGVSLALILLGMFAGTIVFFSQMIRNVTLYREVIVEVTEKDDPDLVRQLENMIKAGPYARPGTVRFISSEEAARSLMEDLGNDPPIEELPGILFDVFNFTVSEKYLSRDSLEALRLELMQYEGINEVYYQEDLDKKALKNITNIGYILLLIGIICIIVSFLLIHHTVKLALYANRFIIKNMELVGASWGFISKPYILRSVVNGLISAVAAIAVLLTFYLFTLQWTEGLNGYTNYIEYLYIFAALILISIILNVFSTWFVVNKYLKMRLNDLF